MPGPFQAIYSASKSFVHSFALALRNELKDTGVTVTSLMPGPTDTEFFERADMLDTKVGAATRTIRPSRPPGLRGADGRQGARRAGSLKTKPQGRGDRLLPDSVKAEFHRGMAEPGSGDDD